MPEIRQHLLQQRKSLTPKQRQQFNLAIYNALIKQPAFQTAQHIACYHAYAGEVSTAEIIHTILRQNKHCYLPNITVGKSLVFSELNATSKTKKDKHGIVEIIDQEKYPADELDLILTPLVGFDQSCNRMGWGQGHYDRCFSFLKQQTRPSKPLLIGLAYECQRLERIDVNEWDVPLDVVITEKNTYMRLG